MEKKLSQFTQELEKNSSQPIIKPAKKRFLAGKIIATLISITLLLVGFLAFKIATAPEDEDGKMNIFTQLRHLITSSDKKVVGEEDDRINLLIMGVGGKNHEGPYLTDSMLLVSLKPSLQKISIISIPRDLLVKIPEIGETKINSAYILSEQANSGSGGNVMRRVVGEMFALDIHYFAVIDFAGFEQIIDELGGITVNVEHTLDDSFYPIPGMESASTSQRYMHLYIEKGIRTMNGETALRYARSRMGLYGEGSDFARSKRQQKVILAIKDKLASPATFLNFGKMNRVYESLLEHLDTNMELWEIIRLYDIAKKTESGGIINVVLDDSPEGPFTATMINGGFYLVPKAGNWTELQELAITIFDIKPKTAVTLNPPSQATPAAVTTPANQRKIEEQKGDFTIEIDNGTSIAGLAQRTSDHLEDEDFQVVSIGNAPIQTYKKSLIYDLKPNENSEKIELLHELERLFGAVLFTSGAPAPVKDADGKDLKYPTDPNSDILIIIGENWANILTELEKR